ncbi:amidohydrolase family protein [Terasakiella pusilla]|uniref:amidohydrolase family protein n=1 Tax=Terasakiella pusilla TaxID=64973 RepID=UPI003AA8E8C3
MNVKIQDDKKDEILNLDAHAHVYTHDLPMKGDRLYSPKEEAVPETYFSYLKDSALDGALLVQPSFFGTDNSYMLDVMTKAKETEGAPTFYGVVVVDPDISMDEMRAMKAQGVIGVRLNLVERPLPEFSQPLWQSFLAAFLELNWHLEVYIEAARLPEFAQMVPFAGNLVVDHFSLPTSPEQLSENLQQLLALEKFTDIFVKLSGAYRVFPQDSFEESAEKCTAYAGQLVELLGRDNLLWGSDWPWTRNDTGQSYSDCVRWGKVWLGEGFARFPQKLL